MLCCFLAWGIVGVLRNETAWGVPQSNLPTAQKGNKWRIQQKGISQHGSLPTYQKGNGYPCKEDNSIGKVFVPLSIEV